MKNLVIDGGNLLHRTFYSAQNNHFVNSNKQNVGHILQYLNNIKYYIEIFKPDNTYIAWDIRDDDFLNFRHQLTEYKQHRDRSQTLDIHKYDKLIWGLCELLGIQCINANKLEADDIISWLCGLHLINDKENIVISSDNDFLQLINYYDNVKIYNPMKKTIICEDNILEFTNGVQINKYLHYKAILGDSSDNISGLYKYGPVKSKKFVEDFKTNYDNLDDDKKKIIKKNIVLMDLRVGLKQYPDEVLFFETQIKNNNVDISKFMDIMKKIDLTPILQNKSEWIDLFCNKQLSDELSIFLETYK